MTQNLRWLTEVKYPGEKIIVWAANEQVAKYENSRKGGRRKRVSMGHAYTWDSTLLEQSYIVGFTSYGGTAGRLGRAPFKVRKPERDGFETWLYDVGPYAFVDFKSVSGHSPKFYLKALGHQTFFKYNWNQVFDGIFYIREMFPCPDQSSTGRGTPEGY